MEYDSDRNARTVARIIGAVILAILASVQGCTWHDENLIHDMSVNGNIDPIVARCAIYGDQNACLIAAGRIEPGE